MTITGKRDKKIPLLLTADMVDGIETLLSVRQKYVSKDCQFLFCNRSGKAMMGWTALKSVISKVEGIMNPAAITSTKLRKYTATMSQVNYVTFATNGFACF